MEREREKYEIEIKIEIGGEKYLKEARYRPAYRQSVRQTCEARNLDAYQETISVTLILNTLEPQNPYDFSHGLELTWK